MGITNVETARTAQRTRTLLRARIDFNGGMSTLECAVRDLSETGARIELGDSVAMPGKFRLFIPKYQKSYDAETRWHRGNSVGIEFVNAPHQSAPKDSDDGRVVKLEAEVAKLRKLIEEIRADPSRARQLLETYD